MSKRYLLPQGQKSSKLKIETDLGARNCLWHRPFGAHHLEVFDAFGT